MRPVLLLARLNEIDSQVDASQARLAEIADALKEPPALRAARAELAQAEAVLARYQHLQREQESARQDAAGKLAHTEERLYSGQVRNPKDLENLQADREQLRRQHSRTEDALLETLIGIETAVERVTEIRSRVDELRAEWQERTQRLQVEQARLRERLAAEQARQKSARQAVPADLLRLYDGLRSRKGGRAVAMLDGDVCDACGVAAPPSKLEAARYNSELVYCDNCGRLIWGE